MRNILYTVLIFSFFKSNAQVGIGTNSPVEEVHLSGASSNVRVEGLNNPNNPKNLGGTNNARVFVNSSGDLVLGDRDKNLDILFDVYNYLKDAEDTGGANSNVITQNGTGTGYQIAGSPNTPGPGTSNFTLSKKAIVEINYNLSWKIQKNVSGIIDDGAERIFQTFMYLIQTAGPVANGPYPKLVTSDADGGGLIVSGRLGLGLSGQFYNNKDKDFGAYKFFYNNGTDYTVLGPGTYQPMFAAQIAVNTTGGTGAVKAFIGGGNDEVQIIAHYYN